MNSLINQILQMVSNGVNPQQLIQQNPQAQILFNQMQQSGMNIKDFTLQFARQNNINIQPIIQQLNQRGIKL
jgi:type IV secretory pathway VirB10-like protein